MTNLRLMAVHAHPDDESSKGAATYAKYAAEGVRVVVVSCTGGESGDILNDEVRSSPRSIWDLPGLRFDEMTAARDVLGVDHRWLGYRDSGLPAEGQLPTPLSFATIDVEISAQPLVRLIRAERPQMVITYDENGGYPHPDHVRAHEVAVRAIEAAADADYHPELGEVWAVSKLYYERIFNTERIEAVYEAGIRSGGEEVAHLTEWMASRLGKDAGVEGVSADNPVEDNAADEGDHIPGTATTHIPVADYFETRDRALRAHRSQVGDEHASYFFWPNALQREAWPFEDFELIWSHVPTALPEDDLFAGLR